MPDALAIETVDLRKHYGAKRALDGLTLQVPTGSICGFLGANGAGKTTTIKVLLGMAHATGGAARLLGVPVDGRGAVEVRARIAFVGEEKDLYDEMTVDQMMRFTASFYPKWRGDLADRYLDRFELSRHDAVKTLSRGMRTKAALLLALCRGAELLILDEPTAGLDPAAIEDVLAALVAHAAGEGSTVFFSSHQIPEVEQIADRVTMIARGRAVVAGPLDDVRDRYRRVQLVFDGDAPTTTFRAPGIERVRRDGRVLTILSSAGEEALLHEARALGPRSVDVFPVTLKDIFLDAVARVEG